MKNVADGKHVTLLYVEDDAEIQKQITSILRLKFPQITLLMAENGQDGLNLFCTHRPDIVLTDIRMPTMNGLQMIREIKGIDKNALTIVLSAVCATDYILEAIDIGINHYVIKPVIMEKLIASIERCLDETGKRRQIMYQEESMRRMAYYDPLTGLPNRQLFDRIFQQALARAQRHRRLMALLYLDLDWFKTINDTHGHTVGDQVLQAVAQRLKSCCQREMDTIARYGGDEFIILLSDPDTSHEASLLAQKIIDAFAHPLVLDGHKLHISLSIGISIYPDNGACEGDLKKNADLSMYRAKKQGRNMFHLSGPTAMSKA